MSRGGDTVASGNLGGNKRFGKSYRLILSILENNELVTNVVEIALLSEINILTDSKVEESMLINKSCNGSVSKFKVYNIILCLTVCLLEYDVRRFVFTCVVVINENHILGRNLFNRLYTTVSESYKSALCYTSGRSLFDVRATS